MKFICVLQFCASVILQVPTSSHTYIQIYIIYISISDRNSIKQKYSRNCCPQRRLFYLNCLKKMCWLFYKYGHKGIFVSYLFHKMIKCLCLTTSVTFVEKSVVHLQVVVVESLQGKEMLFIYYASQQKTQTQRMSLHFLFSFNLLVLGFQTMQK